jgi:hypothetical protein
MRFSLEGCHYYLSYAPATPRAKQIRHESCEQGEESGEKNIVMHHNGYAYSRSRTRPFLLTRWKLQSTHLTA